MLALPVMAALLAGCSPVDALPAPAGDPVAGLALAAPAGAGLVMEADWAQPAADWGLAALLHLPGAEMEEEPLPAELEGLALGGDLLAFRAELAGQVLGFPCGVATLAALGWQMQASGEEWFMPGEWAEVVFEGESGSFRGRVENTAESGCFIWDCALTGFSMDAANAAPLLLPAGAGLGTGRAALLALYGAPHSPANAADAATASVLTWAAGAEASVSFYMAGDAVGGVTLYHRGPGDDTGAAPPALPAGWQPPAALSGDWRDYTVEYGGDLYTLPAPVAAFLQNGWVLRDEAEVPAGQWLRGVVLERDGMVLRTMVSNYEDSDRPLEGCWVNMVEYRLQNGAAQPLRLAGGLDENSSPRQLLEAWGQPDILDGSTSASLAYSYFSEHGRVVFTFRREDEKITVLEVWNRPEALE